MDVSDMLRVDGNGTLYVSGGDVSSGFLHVGYQHTSGGTAGVTISGGGSTWTTGAWDVSVGYYGKGALRIEGGGYLSGMGAVLIDRRAFVSASCLRSLALARKWTFCSSGHPRRR